MRFLTLPWMAVLALLVACAQNPAPASAQKEGRPNVLVIVADDLGWSDLNCYGSHLIESPNLDRLAREGIQFLHGYAAAPVCSPSRASIQTGLYPARLGLTEHIHGYYDDETWLLVPPRIPEGLEPGYPTLGTIGQAAGYRTAHIGKWHLGGEEHHPAKHGYEVTYAGGRYGLPKSFYHPFFEGEPFPDLLSNTAPGSYLTDALADRALALIEEWKEEPWLISLNFYAPHVPIEGRKDWVEYYRKLIDETHDRPFPTVEYAAMVSTLDENVGRILGALEASDELDNTLIIFVSDNGGLHVREIPGFDAHTPPTDNGILRAGKGYLYEGGIRVPFLMRFPAAGGHTGGSLQPVITNDILPTVAAAIGPAGSYQSVDGRSLLPLLTGEGLPPRTLFWHFPHYSPQGGTPAAAARSGPFKLYLDYERDTLWHYNVAARPDERLMLAAPPMDGELLRSLLQWKRSVSAREATRRE